MTRRQIESFEKMLRARRAALINEALRAAQQFEESEDSFPDPADRAAMESDRHAALRIRDRERKLIAKIDEALRRIADGTYGECEECGEPIGIARLRVRPVTTLCIDCKTAQEAAERRERRG